MAEFDAASTDRVWIICGTRMLQFPVQALLDLYMLWLLTQSTDFCICGVSNAFSVAYVFMS